ncbi:hypothetical protein, partial [Streptomyces sp. NPDC005093]
MNPADLLRSLGIDPAQLDPAPPWAPRQSAGAERLDGSHPCALCGKPARATVGGGAGSDHLRAVPLSLVDQRAASDAVHRTAAGR